MITRRVLHDVPKMANIWSALSRDDGDDDDNNDYGSNDHADGNDYKSNDNKDEVSNVIQGDNAGPHSNQTHKRFIDDYCNINNMKWEPQAQQMAHANNFDLDIFPAMSKQHRIT